MSTVSKFTLTKRALMCALVAALSFAGAPRATYAAPPAIVTTTVTTALDHADLATIDTTADGVCNDQIIVPFGMLFLPVTVCSLRSAINTSRETVGDDLIVFSPALSGTVIALKGTVINWKSSDTTVDGQGQAIVIDGAGMNAGQNMIAISGSYNTLQQVSLTRARLHALLVGDMPSDGVGNNNEILGVVFYGNQNAAALSIVGSSAGGGRGNSVTASGFGISDPLTPRATCDPALSNDVGIRISGGAQNTLLESTFVFCSAGAGVQIFDAETRGTTIYRDVIGGGPGLGVGLGNGVGVHVQNAQNTVIDGVAILSNLRSGIHINGAATHDVRISNSYIGDYDRGGPRGLAGINGADGVLIQDVPDAAATLVDSVVPGNGRDGIRIEHSQAITITRNSIGFYDDGSGLLLGRNINGVSLVGGTQRTRVLDNTIAYNTNLGVWISGAGTSGNGVAGNQVHSQQNSGVEISGGATFNAIGAESISFLGISGVAGNSIYSNTREGVYIAGPGTANNAVVANTIGAYAGNVYPNGLNGILLNDNTTSNAIGGNVAGLELANMISGNGANGIWLTNNANNNSVVGNAIGANPELGGVSGNGQNGILLSNTAMDNVIGGPTAADRNLVRGNAGDGLALNGATVSNNQIGGNDFLRNTANGIGIYAGATNTFNGSAGEPIGVVANQRSGIYVSGANNNTFNNIYAVDNVHYGILIEGDRNVLTAIEARYNGYDGIADRNGAADNVWSNLRTGQNGGLGIDRDASTDAGNISSASTVTVTAYNPGSGAMTVAGLTPATAYEVYVADPDPSGFGEGARVSLAFSTAAAVTSLNITIPAADRAANCFTVLRTSAPSGEFSRTYCRALPQSIVFYAVADRTLAQPLTFSAVATASSGLPVAFSGGAPGVCTVAANGAITVVGVGTCYVVASQPGNATVGMAMAVPRSFVISKAPQSITLATPADRALGNAPFAVTVSASSGLSVVLTSGSPGVCAISGATVTLLHAGTCTLDARQPGNATYDAAPWVARAFQVTQAAQTITFAQPGTALRSSRALSMTASSSSALPVAFGGGTPGVCSISAAGTVTLLGAGACTVIATQAGNADYSAAPPVTRTLTVSYGLLLPLALRR
jgi:hypothetical protein